MKIVVDTGLFIAAANDREPAHELARGLLTMYGRDVVILDTVATETDMLLRRRLGNHAGRAFLDALAREEHSTAFLTPGLLKRAAELDARYADLGLGLVDASIMAYAERHDLPILTFDFAHFRATAGAGGPWRLVIDESRLRELLGFDP